MAGDSGAKAVTCPEVETASSRKHDVVPEGWMPQSRSRPATMEMYEPGGAGIATRVSAANDPAVDPQRAGGVAPTRLITRPGSHHGEETGSAVLARHTESPALGAKGPNGIGPKPASYDEFKCRIHAGNVALPILAAMKKTASVAASALLLSWL